MKPILHFIAVCRVDLYHSLLAFISVEVGCCPTMDEPVNLIYCVMISLPSFCCSGGTKLIYFIFRNYRSTQFFDPAGNLLNGNYLFLYFYSRGFNAKHYNSTFLSISNPPAPHPHYLQRGKVILLTEEVSEIKKSSV